METKTKKSTEARSKARAPKALPYTGPLSDLIEAEADDVRKVLGMVSVAMCVDSESPLAPEADDYGAFLEVVQDKLSEVYTRLEAAIDTLDQIDQALQRDYDRAKSSDHKPKRAAA